MRFSIDEYNFELLKFNNNMLFVKIKDNNGLFSM